MTGEPLAQDRGPARLTPYQMRRDAARWRKSKQTDRSILYRGAQLTEAQRIMTAVPDLAAMEEIAPFLLASALRQRSLWRNLLIGVTLVSLVLLTLALIAEHLREIAEERRALAQSRQLAMQSRTEPAPVLSLLMAAQAYSEKPTGEAAANLLDRLQTWPKLAGVLHGRLALASIATNAKTQTILAGTSNGSLFQWSSQSFASPLDAIRASTGAVDTLAVDSHTGDVWAGYEDGRVLVWKTLDRPVPIAGIPPRLDLTDAAKINTLRLGPKIGALAFSGSSALAAVGTAAGTGEATIFATFPPTIYWRLGPPWDRRRCGAGNAHNGTRSSMYCN